MPLSSNSSYPFLRRALLQALYYASAQAVQVRPGSSGGLLAVVQLIDSDACDQQQQSLPLENAERPLQHPLHQHRYHQNLQ